MFWVFLKLTLEDYLRSLLLIGQMIMPSSWLEHSRNFLGYVNIYHCVILAFIFNSIVSSSSYQSNMKNLWYPNIKYDCWFNVCIAYFSMCLHSFAIRYTVAIVIIQTLQCKCFIIPMFFSLVILSLMVIYIYSNLFWNSFNKMHYIIMVE